MKKITVQHFIKATGRKPQHDDMKRVNCKDAGKVGHYMCGWDEKRDMPKFMPLEPTRITDPIVHLDSRHSYSLCFGLKQEDVRADNVTRDKSKVTCTACKKLIK